jgi:hypothetical protein
MTTSTEEQETYILDRLQEFLENEISYAAVIHSENLYHEEYDIITRALIWSRGESEYPFVYGCDGNVYLIDKGMSKRMITDLHNALTAGIVNYLLYDDEN